ncbi:MAG: phosphate transport system protein [Oleiphilaceae bacterium]|jgi:phosphate transport system protein
MVATKEAHSYHISQKVIDELENIKTYLLEMCGLVESQVGGAFKAIIDADSQWATRERETDKRLNQMEVDIDEE